MKVAIVGVSGAVGQEFLRVLDEQNFPIDELLLFGSERSAGKTYEFRGQKHTVRLLQHNDDFKGVDFAFVSAGAGVSREFAETITKHGAIMIDNSSAFRMDKDVPLVVPEVNGEDAFDTPRGIIANPLNDISPIKRVHVATYQAASGAGAVAMAELEKQYAELAEGKEPTVEKFAYQLAYNLIPHIDVFLDNDYTKEEAHNAFEHAEGLVVIDEPAAKKYPMPLDAAGKDPVYAGRLRKDIANPNGLTFWLVGDQIKKGAALNAVQIAQYMLAHPRS